MLKLKNLISVKVLAIPILLIILPVFANADIYYYSEEEYQDLSKEEVLKYWEDLENTVMMMQAREEKAQIQIERNQTTIEELKVRLREAEAEYNAIYNRIMEKLGGITHSQLVEFQKKLDEIRSKLDYYDEMPNTELFKNNQEIKNFIKNYEKLSKQNIAQVPEIAPEFKELDRRIEKLSEALPHYYEDKHTVVKGEYLSKISGYKHIYNDPVKWGIIYRANRDKIKDPDLIYPEQVFKIPRGLPTTWKVYKGECLWTISGYPEIYDNPFNWPKIYRANKNQIKDPDLIYPNQILHIPRN